MRRCSGVTESTRPSKNSPPSGSTTTRSPRSKDGPRDRDLSWAACRHAKISKQSPITDPLLRRASSGKPNVAHRSTTLRSTEPSRPRHFVLRWFRDGKDRLRSVEASNHPMSELQAIEAQGGGGYGPPPGGYGPPPGGAPPGGGYPPPGGGGYGPPPGGGGYGPPPVVVATVRHPAVVH